MQKQGKNSNGSIKAEHINSPENLKKKPKNMFLGGVGDQIHTDTR